ncbi:MAG: two-component regulator propeller domain-containing protein [Acidobacteriota bacterium]
MRSQVRRTPLLGSGGVLAVLLLAQTALSQVYQFRNYSAASGLSDNFVFDIHQDRNGMIWFATSTGVSRYNGVEFTNLTIKDGLVHNAVRHIHEDSEGRMWFATGGGISVLENGKFRSYTQQDGLPHDFIQQIAQDRKGNLWFGTRGNGLSKLDRNGRFTNYGVSAGLKVKTVWVLTVDRQDVLWIGGREGGLHRFDGKSFRAYTTADGLPDNQIFSLAEDRDGNLWVGTANGLCRFDGKRFHVVSLGNGLLRNTSHVLQDRRGALWFGLYGKGVVRYDGAHFTQFRDENGLANNFVVVLFEDRESNLWIGTQGGGVSKFIGERFVNYTASQGLCREPVHAVAQDPQGGLWFGSYGGGLCRFDGHQFTHLRAEDGLVHDLVGDLLVSHGRLYVATNGGLSVYQKGTFKNYTVRDGLPINILSVLKQDHHGNIWIGTFGGGVSRFDGVGFTNYSVAQGLLNDRVHAILEDRQHRIWLGTDDGVTVLDLEKERSRNYTRAQGLLPGKVSAIIETGDGALWFGTDSGLSRFDGERFTSITTDNGLADSVVHFLELGPRGQLWIGTNKGVSLLDLKSRQIRNFDTRDGLVANETLMGASFLDRDGYLWIGTTGGVSRCNPLYEDVVSAPPLVYLEAVKVFDQAVPLAPLIQLEPAANQVTFSFVGVSYRDESRVKYRYILEGFDAGWSPASDVRFAKYTNLPPGDFRFHVQAANSDGFWNEQGASVQLRILPPIYQKPSFQLLVLVGLVGLVGGVVKWRVWRIRRSNLDLERKVQARTHEVTLQKELLAKSNEELHALQETSTAMSSTLERSDLTRLILEASMALLNCPGGFLIEHVRGQDMIRVDEALGLAEKLKGLALPIQNTLTQEIIATRSSRAFSWPEIKQRVTHPALVPLLTPCQVVMVPIMFSGRVLGVLALGRRYPGEPFTERDLTVLTTFANQAAVALRNAELYEDIRSSELKYRTLVEQAGDAIFVFDAEGRIDSVNPSAIQLLGYTEQDYRSLRFWDLDASNYQAHFVDHFLVEKELGGDLASIELRHQDGRLVPVEINCVPLGEGFYQAIVRDITVRKLLEQDLAQQRDRAEEASRLKSEFLASISHELRTPLQAVLSYADFGIEKFEQATRERLGSYFHEIKDSGSLLLRMINDLLDLSRMEAGKMRYTRAPVSMKVVVDDACSRAAKLADMKQIRLTACPIPAEWVVYGDYEMLLRVLSNLLSNAIKFTPQQGEITVLGETSRGTYTFAVRDSGQGIFQEEIESIFDKFTQSNLQSQTNRAGSGLGLSICRGIIDAHSGKIWAESRGPGLGSTFYFTLPAHQEVSIASD